MIDQLGQKRDRLKTTYINTQLLSTSLQTVPDVWDNFQGLLQWDEIIQDIHLYQCIHILILSAVSIILNWGEWYMESFIRDFILILYPFLLYCILLHAPLPLHIFGLRWKKATMLTFVVYIQLALKMMIQYICSLVLVT